MPADGAVSVRAWLFDARGRLAAVHLRRGAGAALPSDAVSNAAAESELLLRHVTGRSRASLFAWPEATLDAAELARLERSLDRCLGGEPLAYVIGSREFWSLDFEVGPDVLVPRADTETLVERALALSRAVPDGPLLDAGTGSGAVAVALATECERTIVATDRHAPALRLAVRNARRHLAPGRIAFLQADWLETLTDESLALLVSNPPYLAEHDPHLASLAAEPITALVCEDDGFDAIRRLLEQGARVVMPGGAVALEHGFAQGEAVRSLFARNGYTDVVTTRDLAGHERVSEGRRPPPEPAGAPGKTRGEAHGRGDRPERVEDQSVG